MLIVADKNIPLLRETFGRHARLRLRAGREIDRADLDGADALLVKSITRVTAGLLEGTPVRFVGSATIGFDHIETARLEERGIHWTSAPGCNADAAAQYTLAMILLACERLGMDPRELTVGIIGRGNVGSRVQRLVGAMGMASVANDPPLADAGVEGLVTQAEALACDIVCLHVPLTRDGPYPTWRMIDTRSLARMPDGALLVNSARGDVVDGAALLDRIESGRLRAALDVWPGEPALSADLLSVSHVATPHVAGYSEEGRRNGALMIYRSFCCWAGLEEDTGVVPAAPRQRLWAGGEDVAALVRQVTHIEEDDRAMRRLADLDMEQRKAAFDRLRKDYPLRSDFGAWDIEGTGADAGRTLRSLGFELA